MSYSYKRLSPELYKDLIYISKSAFNIDPSIDYYKKKNATSIFGEPYLGFIAYSESGEPAAFYGVYAHPIILNEKQYCAAQSGDTMTHKDHMGKGLFTTLAKMTYDLAKEKGIEFIFGFPNSNSYPGFVKKLDWLCPYTMKEYRSRVMTIPLAKLAKKSKVFHPIYKSFCYFMFVFFKPKNKTFQSSVIEAEVGGVHRTEDFISYKSFSGCRIIKLGNTHLWIKIDGFLFIGDMERNERDSYELIWKKIKRLSFFLGIDTIILQVSPGEFIDRKLSSFLKSKDTFSFGFLNLSGRLDPQKFKYVSGDVDTF